MTALGLAVAATVMALGVLHRPRPIRPVSPAPSQAATRKTPSQAATQERLAPSQAATQERPAPQVGMIGVWCAGIFGQRLDASSRVARQIGGAVCVTPVVLVAPAVGVVSLAGAVALPVLVDRRDKRHHDRRLLEELPELIDLLAVAVAGGRTVPLAIDDVVGLVPGTVAEALAQCRRRAGLGKRLADELEALPAQQGELVRPLVRALVATERYGTPIGPSLDAAASDVRVRRRRAAERRARQLPVKMLFPLVVCVLPAFALLTVVPVLVDAFSVIGR